MTSDLKDIINLIINCELGQPEKGMNISEFEECLGLLGDWLTETVEGTKKKPINRIISLAQNEKKTKEVWLIINQLLQKDNT